MSFASRVIERLAPRGVGPPDGREDGHVGAPAPPPDHLCAGGRLRRDGLGTEDRGQSWRARLERDRLRVRLLRGHERHRLREGLVDNNPPWNIATGLVLLLGRYPALIIPLAIAGAMGRKAWLPRNAETLRTDDLTFAGLLLGTMLLVGALSFLPAVVLGPVADFLARPPI
jgi:hypothetical protein